MRQGLAGRWELSGQPDRRSQAAGHVAPGPRQSSHTMNQDSSQSASQGAAEKPSVRHQENQMPRRQGQRGHPPEAAFLPRSASAQDPEGWEVGAFQTEAKDGREQPHSSSACTGGTKGAEASWAPGAEGGRVAKCWPSGCGQKSQAAALER